VDRQSGQKQQTNGEKQLDNATFFARLAKRLVSILTMQTISGRLYEVDTRLRPSGQSGLLVTSLTAFEQYQNEDAWTWEHQALLRSRPVAGNAELAVIFNDLRARVLQNSVRRESLKTDVRTMRERMRNELSKGKADIFDIKQDTGGIGDIEFIVQYLILKEAQTKPDLLRYSDNIRQIEALRNAAIITEEEAGTLSDIYRAYRESINHLALAGRPGLISEIDFLAEEFSEFRQSITTLWTKYLND
jgi:glutamate-ammonia-ligase adenylyltransferase